MVYDSTRPRIFVEKKRDGWYAWIDWQIPIQKQIKYGAFEYARRAERITARLNGLHEGDYVSQRRQDCNLISKLRSQDEDMSLPF